MADNSGLFAVSQRLPPQNLQAEQALLGALITRNTIFDKIVDLIETKHFADPANAIIFQRISERILDGQLADAVTLRDDFQNSGLLTDVGGTAYLATLLAATVALNIVPNYARSIVDCWTRRQLIEVGQSIVNRAFDPGPSAVDAHTLKDAASQIEDAERMLGELHGADAEAVKLHSGGSAISAAIARADAIHRGAPSGRVLTGMPSIDRAWLAMPGTLTLLAGPPGSGKTGAAMQIGKAVARRAYADALAFGLPPKQAYRQPGVAVYSLEMTAEALGLRMAAEEAGVDVMDLLLGRLDLVSAEALARVERETTHLPIRIHDASAATIRMLPAKIRMDLKRQPERLVIIDHLLVATEQAQAERGRSDGGVSAQSVTSLAQTLRRLAVALRVPILVLTHTSRPQRGAEVRRPTMAEIKYGGEGGATCVMFLHRPIMFMDSQPPEPMAKETDAQFRGPGGRLDRWHKARDAARDLAEIVVAKQTHGTTGVYPMRWNGRTTSLSEVEGADLGPAEPVPDFL